MRVKLYTAAGMPEALACIRAELGDDAVILSTRRIQGGIEVTAGLEIPDSDPAPLPRAPAAKRTEARGRAAPAHADNLLLAHNTPAPLAAKLAAAPLPFALSIVLRFQPLDPARPLLVVGPPGAGKTLTVARLATRLVLQGARPAIATADTRRAGAYEQLAAYTDLLGLDLRRCDAAGPVAALIDTAGLDPFDQADRDELQTLARATNARMALVLPAGLDSGEAADLAQGFAACGASHLIATRLDIARRLGGILAAAQHIPLAEAGIGPSAAEGLQPMTPELLAACLQRRPARSSAR
jgi:flagellar biosynthesis protein FlhF